MSIISTGRFSRAAKWVTSWKGLIVLALTVIGGGGAWAVRAYLDRHDAVAHAPLDAKIELIRADVTTVKLDVAEIKGMVQGALLTRPAYGPPPPPAPRPIPRAGNP